MREIFLVRFFVDFLFGGPLGLGGPLFGKFFFSGSGRWGPFPKLNILLYVILFCFCFSL